MRQHLKSCQAVIIDLRGNCGGVMDAATEIAAYFLPYGKFIAQFASADGTVRCATSANRRPELQTALCILVDGITASASELLAAALEEHGQAVVWGGRTFGKVR